MKYLNKDDHSRDAECAEDAKRQTETLEERLAELEAQQAAAQGLARITPLLESGYLLLDLKREPEAWRAAREAFDLAIDAEQWAEAVEACDVMAQTDEPNSVKAIAHGIWLGVTFPIDPELSVAMLQHLIDNTPPDSDGAAVAAAVARYVVDLRAEGKQRDDLQFFTGQMIGNVARRHSNVEDQDTFEFWLDINGLDDQDKILPRLGKVLDVLVTDGWWLDRDAIRQRIPD